MSKYCVFDNKTGIKKYKSKEICDKAYNAQKEAHELGIAPKVIKRINDLSYQTEIADTSFFMKNFKEMVYYNEIFPDLHNKLKPIFNKYKIHKTGPDGIDLARHNLGLYHGKVVMIDFS